MLRIAIVRSPGAISSIIRTPSAMICTERRVAAVAPSSPMLLYASASVGNACVRVRSAWHSAVTPAVRKSIDCSRAEQSLSVRCAAVPTEALGRLSLNRCA